MNALDALGTVLEMADSTEECPHATLTLITEVDGWRDAEETMAGSLESAMVQAARGGITLEHLQEVVWHTLIIAAATGYTLGSSHAYDVTLSSDVVVPDDLASLDFLEPLDSPRESE